MSRTIPFTKMHAAGNDYVYVDGFDVRLDDPATLAAAMSHRRFGVGADGLIVFGPSERADVRMRMWNSDGTEAEMCGNGLRCVARLAYERGRVGGRTAFRVETGAGILPVHVEARDGAVTAVRVGMGHPRLDRADVPMEGPPGRAVDEPIDVPGATLRATCLSMGNPHCVVFVDDVEAVPIDRWGPALERHRAFPQRTNVEFAQVVGRGEVAQRTWERGAGETWACGTGASAVCVAGVLTGRADRRVRVRLRGGVLGVEWTPDGEVEVTGPAVEVFRGEWNVR